MEETVSDAVLVALISAGTTLAGIALKSIVERRK